MIPGQLINPEVNFASEHALTPVTVHMSFPLPRAALRGGLPVVRYRATQLAEVIFSMCTERKSCPGARVVMRMLIILNVCNKFPNKKLDEASEIGKHMFKIHSV